MVEELKSMVGMDETILYEGKPDKKCFIFDEYVLLYGYFREEKLKKEMSISNNLKKRGIFK